MIPTYFEADDKGHEFNVFMNEMMLKFNGKTLNEIKYFIKMMIENDFKVAD